MVQILKYIVLFFVFLNSVQNARYSSNLTNGARSNNNNTMPRFSIGAYMKKKKQANKEKISKREDIERLEIEIKEQEDTSTINKSNIIPLLPCTRWSFSLQWRDECRALIGGEGFTFVYSGSI